MRITEVDVPAQHWLVQQHDVRLADLAQVMGPTFLYVTMYAQIHGLVTAGPSLTRVLEYTPGLDRIRLEVGYPLLMAAPALKDDVYYVAVPACRALKGEHIGPYDGLQAAHQRMKIALKERKLSQTAPLWEQYTRGPEQNQAPNTWLTEIYYPIG
jgi:effector-binding domain-containing protein